MEPQIVTEEFSLLLEDYKLHVQKQLNALKTKVEFVNDFFHNKIGYQNVNERLDNMEKGIICLKLRNEKDMEMQTRYVHYYCGMNGIITVLLSLFLVSVYF
jgi:hypothetical protein